MPSAAGSKEVHLLYSPKSRATEFASVQWQFLIAAAANIARAFAIVHRNHHVIGDVNHSSTMIATNATVRLIDCDSFQISAANRIFKCEVGEPGHTAPELQGKQLAQVIRTPTHDNFGLAVLVFELLFMGRHPFGGQFTGQGDLTLEQKIAGFLFAYGAGATNRKMKQPPFSLSLDGVSPRVASMFEAAFGPNGPNTRPAAADWASALDELRAQTKQCSIQRGHFYYNQLAQCPWCPIEAKLGLSLFTVQFAPASTHPGFDLNLIWESILKIPRPIPRHILPPANSIAPGNPNHDFLDSGRSRKMHLSILITSAAVTAFISVFSLAISTLPLTVFLVFLMRSLSKWGQWSTLKRDARNRVDEFKLHYEKTRSIYQHWADGHLFADCFKELETTRQTLVGLPKEKDRAIGDLMNRAELVLRKQFLNRFQIKPGVVSGIGYSRCADLQFYNIETAADIEWNAVQQVRGIGPALASNLVAWRQSLESKFRFDPNSITKTPEFRQIESNFAQKQSQLELDLMGGTKRLNDIVVQSESHRALLEPQMRDATSNLAQALADLKAL